MRITSWKEFKTMQLMKKIILSSMLFAAAAMAFVSCQKSETAPEVKPVTLTFTSANPDTKTEYNGETIVWSAGDVIRMACKANGFWQEENGAVAEGGNARLYTVNIREKESSETGTFVLHDFYANATPGPYEFYTIYPSSAKSGTAFKNGVADLTIPAKQISSAETFDKTADILWGKAALAYDELPTDAIPLLWNRLVAHAYITLENIKGTTSGEAIKSIKLTAQDGAALVGVYSVDVATGEFSATTPSNSLEVTCTDITVDENGNASFWACINPCTITSLDIEVTTDKAIYTTSKTGFTREFLQNRRNLLSINMSEASKEALEVEVLPTIEGYTRIESIDQIVTGEYVIACDVNGAYYAASTTIASNALTSISLELNDMTLSFPSAAEDHVFTFTREGNAVYISANDKYLSKKSTGTGLQYIDDPEKWNLITSHGLGIATSSETILQSSTQTNRLLMYYCESGKTPGFKAATTNYSDNQYKHLTLFKKN